MYLDHFGLREAPFRITPHTEFFFFGAQRGTTLDALVYAVTRDEGIVKVSGEVGSGKTMLCRMLLERLPDNVATVHLADPTLARDEILYAIADELQVPLPDQRPHQLLRALQERLIEIYATGRQVVVMVDEAHAMPAETLEAIRLLSNLESNRHKLMHLVLFGQPELDEMLRDPAMRPLKERITHNFALEPLRPDDVGEYRMFRLRAAGYHGADLFTAGAVARLARASEGLTRRINILADKALLAAFVDGRHQVDRKQVDTAIRDAQFNPLSGSRARQTRWIVTGTALTLVALLVAVAITWQADGGAQPANPTGQHATSAAPPAAASVAAEPLPTADAAQLAPDDGTAKVMPEATAEPTLAERIAASEDWLRSTPGGHYVVQLLNVDSERQDEVVDFLATRTPALDAQRLHVYRSNLSGRDRIGVVYGDYASRKEADADRRRLARICGGAPYVRPLSKLR